MATIVNNPPQSSSSGGIWGIIIALIVMFVLIYLGFVYGLPAIQNMKLGTPQINIPEKIDVNVQQAK